MRPTWVEPALNEVILSAFPTASMRYFPSGVPDGNKPAPSHGKKASVRWGAVDEALGTGRGSSAVPSSVFDACQDKQAQRVWHRLQLKYGPRARSTKPGSYPRCRLDAQHRELSQNGVEGMKKEETPLLVPHAVITIGGFEAPDLRSKVLPSIAEYIPTLATPPQRKEGEAGDRSVAGRVETVRGRRRMPSYYTKKYQDRDLFQGKGCLATGSSLLELPLRAVVENTRTADAPNERIFAVITGGPVTLTDIEREPHPPRRAVLRSGMGVSLPLLNQALPRPVVAAATLLRQHDTKINPSVTEVSSAFWVSAVSHYISCGLFAPEALTVLSEEDRQILEAAQRATENVFGNPLSLSCDSGSPETQTEELLAARREEYCLSTALAAGTYEWIASASQVEWEETLLKNFFLPEERMESSVDVGILSRRRDTLDPNSVNWWNVRTLEGIFARITQDITF